MPLLLLACLFLLPHCFTLVAGEEDFISFPLERRRGTNIRRDLYTSSGHLRTIDYTRKESDGVYWTTIRIGSPVQQSFSVIVDTGSSTIAVPCKNCDCGAHHNQFDASRSSTVQNLNRAYRQCYSEGSCNSGTIFSDLACFGEECTVKQAVRHQFGCCSTYAPAFRAQEADGIIGLSGSADTLVASLRAQRDLHRNMFAICFGKREGLLTVGGVYHRPLLEEFTYVPLFGSVGSSFYTVKVSGVGLNGRLVDPTTIIAMIDSGSTFTYIPRFLHEQIKVEFQHFCGNQTLAATGGAKCRGQLNPSATPKEDIRDSLACYSPPAGVTDIEHWLFQDFPQLSIQFDSQDTTSRICLSPRSYFFQSARNVYCAGIFPDRTGRMIIGAVSMADYSVVFDNEHHRVGFAKSNCDGDKTKRVFDCCGETCAGYTYVPPPGQTLRPTPLSADHRNAVLEFGSGGKTEQTAPPIVANQDAEEEEEEEFVALPKVPRPTVGDAILEEPTVGTVAPPSPGKHGKDYTVVIVGISFAMGALLAVCLVATCAWLRRFRFTRLSSVEVEEEASSALELEPEEQRGITTS